MTRGDLDWLRAEAVDRRRQRQAPKRIQRQRTKGWRMPPGAIYVGRPTRWGNPFEVGAEGVAWSGEACGSPGRYDPGRAVWHDQVPLGRLTAAQAVELYRTDLGWALSVHVLDPPADQAHARQLRADLAALAGRDLACWCDLAEPCHADVLLELANA